jgi:hypothetical protein
LRGLRRLREAGDGEDGGQEGDRESWSWHGSDRLTSGAKYATISVKYD